MHFLNAYFQPLIPILAKTLHVIFFLCYIFIFLKFCLKITWFKIGGKLIPRSKIYLRAIDCMQTSFLIFCGAFFREHQEVMALPVLLERG